MGRVVIGTLMRPRCNARGGQWAPSRAHKGHMMDGSDHSRHALARRGPPLRKWPFRPILAEIMGGARGAGVPAMLVQNDGLLAE